MSRWTITSCGSLTNSRRFLPRHFLSRSEVRDGQTMQEKITGLADDAERSLLESQEMLWRIFGQDVEQD